MQQLYVYNVAHTGCPGCPASPFSPTAPSSPGVPTGPALPVAPASPSSPTGPCKPVIPGRPIGPEAPCKHQFHLDKLCGYGTKRKTAFCRQTYWRPRWTLRPFVSHITRVSLDGCWTWDTIGAGWTRGSLQLGTEECSR